MKKHPLLRDLLKDASKRKSKFTLVGIGPVSGAVVEATIAACRKNDCPPIFIASRNQVDLKKLGHGYLMGGMDQKAFVTFIRKIAERLRYTGPIYICRDHGGPWQRNVELDGKYPLDKAMAIAKESFKADIEAGFNYIHIDPTKCPFKFSQQDLADWTVELMEFCEQVRIKAGLDPIDYEVGAEDIQGGLTTPETYGRYLQSLSKTLAEKNLPLPTCVVGQTGTLTRADRNVGHLDLQATRKLIEIARKCGIGFKEHNGDYLSAASCRIHPDLGISGMNVAPEFGLVQTDALLHLADLEEKLVREKWVKESAASNLRNLFLQKTFANAPWSKWLPADLKSWPREKLEQDSAARLLIARVCGHYVYDDKAVAAAIKKMMANIKRHQLAKDPEQYVMTQVQSSIEFYIDNFRMKGLNKILRAMTTTKKPVKKTR